MNGTITKVLSVNVFTPGDYQPGGVITSDVVDAYAPPYREVPLLELDPKQYQFYLPQGGNDPLQPKVGMRVSFVVKNDLHAEYADEVTPL